VILAGLPLAAYGGPAAEREFQSVAHLHPNVAHGQDLFDTCAACHGKAGGGVSDGSVPVIAGQSFRFIAWQLVSFRHGDRKDPRMQHFTGQHHLSGAQDIADVAAYASQLQPTQPSAQGNGSPGPGAEIYERDCASCHGAKADGDEAKGYPRLAAQHYDYLLHQMRDPLEDRRPGLARDHAHLIQRLDSSALADVCDYLSRLPP
jgi:cytochrome c553